MIRHIVSHLILSYRTLPSPRWHATYAGQFVVERRIDASKTACCLYGNCRSLYRSNMRSGLIDGTFFTSTPAVDNAINVLERAVHAPKDSTCAPSKQALNTTLALPSHDRLTPYLKAGGCAVVLLILKFWYVTTWFLC